MALTATVHRFQIDLSDVDRGVYEALDLRVARHPSESVPFLLTRLLAYALSYEEGLAFSKGLSTADEPAIWKKDPGGRILLWIDVGNPAAERLHKASKAADRVVVFTHHDPRLLQREARTRAIHDVENIEVYAVAPAFLAEIEPHLDRHTKLALVRTGEQLYVTAGEQSIEGTLTRCSLVTPAEPTE
jgi:uncharacterized protein YaeQ